VAPPASTSSGSSTPWGWIIAILAVVAVALIVVLALMRRSSNRAKAEWKNAAASALRDADLTRDMLADEARPGEAEDVRRVAAVRDAVERVASQFDRLATTAPNDETRQNSIALAASLRGYFFALESEQMLHDAPTTPTADQLATADATKRARAAELGAAVAAIRAYVAPDSSTQ
jgi:Zn-dependent oligopeptidase